LIIEKKKRGCSVASQTCSRKKETKDPTRPYNPTEEKHHAAQVRQPKRGRRPPRRWLPSGPLLKIKRQGKRAQKKGTRKGKQKQSGQRNDPACTGAGE